MKNIHDRNLIINVRMLKKYFMVDRLAYMRRFFQGANISNGLLRAVDGINFELHQNETLGLVGESGCGKTTVARCLLRLLEPTEGQVLIDDIDIVKLSGIQLRQIRRKIQMVFQHPETSLNPRLTVGKIVGEPLFRFGIVKTHKEANERIMDLIHKVGMPADCIDRYPHELSGGQKQRVGIMRALISKPEVIILDEPTSALDVSVAAQVLKLLRGLQKQHNVSYLFISHDLSTVRYLCDRVAVMYMGKLVEVGLTDDVFSNSFHPYTQALFSAVPIPDPSATREEYIRLRGELSRGAIKPYTCQLAPRCPFVFDRCHREEPKLVEISPKHFVSCFLHQST